LYRYNKGLIPTTARQVPLNVVRFVSVEWCKKMLTNVD
jgi:solute carrier family 25 oxoglutarate transporter 11